MSNFMAGRSGLALRDNGGRIGNGDLNQMADALLAAKRVYGGILGGEGIYAGGAAALGDITDGTDYPAVTIVVADDSGELWPFKTTSATEIVFNVASTAAGDARLYAVPTLLSGVSPAAADGRYNQVRFVADDVANAAPAHSLLLGTGTITASALTAFTAGSTAPATSTVAPKAHAASHADGAADAVTPASIKAVKGPGAVTADRLMVFDGTTGYLAKQGALTEASLPTLAGANVFTARNTFANGLLASVADAKFGSPAAGTWAVGDRWRDASCAEWVCTVAGTPGTWKQCTIGVADTWAGGGAADITTAANWQTGALLSGYRVYDASAGELQVYTYNGAVWLGAEFTVGMNPYTNWVAAGYAASTNLLYSYPLSPLHDVIVTACHWIVSGATADASNKWQMDLRYSGATSILTLEKVANGNTYYTGTPTATVLNQGTHRQLYVEYTKVGSPANMTNNAVSLTLRYVRR